MTRRLSVTGNTPLNENKLLFSLIFLSSMIHLGIYCLSEFVFDVDPERIDEEWVIEVGVLGDETSLPLVSEESKSASSRRLLPQLPKTFTIDKGKKAEEGFNDEATKETEEPQSGDSEDNSELVKDDEDAAKKLKMSEALRRLALEELRRQEKEEKKKEQDDASQKIKGAKKLEDAKVLAKTEAVHMNYGRVLKKQILRHYRLPRTFSSPIANLKVVLTVIVNGRGNLVSVKVQKSSKDPVFDEYSIKAAKNASPYELPPKSLAGRKISLVFTR